MITKEIWQEFNVELLGFIKSKVSSNEQAEDILQEVFIKIHQNIETLNDTQKIAGWVYQITRNTIVDFYRKNKMVNVGVEFLEDIPDESSRSFEGFTKCLGPFINQLEDKDKELILNTTLSNKTVKDYAEMHNLNYSSTKSRLQRARKKLHSLFVECCELESDKYGNIISSNKEKCSC